VEVNVTIVTDTGHSLRGARVYLSGPMDFVVSRPDEAKFGWRRRIGQVLNDMGVIVFDPWEKPDVRWFHEYGKEKEDSQDQIKRLWTYDPSPAGQEARAWCASRFWQTLHVDLRMVDTADFLVAYCPTTTYSVGTVHEIAMARLQRKPVLLVTPRVVLPELEQLREHLKSDVRGRALLSGLERKLPLKANPDAIPSLWYMPLLGGHNFFDGFGFDALRNKFAWQVGPLDYAEKNSPPLRPLLPFLLSLEAGQKPQKFSLGMQTTLDDDDWLIWDIRRKPRSDVKTKKPKPKRNTA
jgi:hypothetical protein